MKSIKELRTVLSFHPEEINSSVAFFAENCSIDFDVYLPTKGRNLQRGLVWTLNQKRELIWSILINRRIPRMAMLNVLHSNDNVDGKYQVIDGKQRLSAMIDFYKGKYTLEIDGVEYFFSELPIDYQRVIGGYMFPYYIVNENYKSQFTDEQKISWFKYINFAGTPQDEEHFKGLE